MEGKTISWGGWGGWLMSTNSTDHHLPFCDLSA